MTANVADEKIVPENGLEVRYERYKGIIKNYMAFLFTILTGISKKPMIAFRTKHILYM